MLNSRYSPERNIWLLILIIMLLAMISIGGTTRLTRSGLSITEWQPITGTLPPLSDRDWQTMFDKYKTSPEFQKVNTHFELADYKRIFFWEYIHRLFGRIIFLWSLIPGVWLWRKNKAEARLVIALPILIAIQGLVGWLMVKSGLQHDPKVSPYMLALHYFMALVTLMTAYFYLSKRRARLPTKLDKLQKISFGLLGAAILIQLFFGCLTSGFRAGFIYNEFPLMGGDFLPEAAFTYPSILQNLFANSALIQWVHRWLGITTLFLIYLNAYIFISRSGAQFRNSFIHLASIATIQVILGILLLLWAVPLPLAVFHQFMATLILLGFCNILFRLERLA